MKNVIIFIILLSAVSVIGVFSLAIYSSTYDDINATMTPELQPAFNITTNTVATTVTLTSLLPYLFVLAAFIAAFVAIIAIVNRRR